MATDPAALLCARSCASGPSLQLVFEQPTRSHRQQVLGCVEAHRPKILLFELYSPVDQLASLLAQVRVLVPDCYIVGLGATNSTDEMVLALRAGCNDYAWPPLESSIGAALARALDILAPADRPAAQPGGTVLAFLSAKGGCGATTVACHTAVELRRLLGERVLLLDLDFAAGMIGFLMQAPPRHSFLDAANNTARLDSSYWDALVTNRDGLDVLPAPPQAMACRALPARAIAHVFRHLRSTYRVIVADLGRGIGPFADSFLDAADRVILVTTTEPAALAQARQLSDYLEETRNPRVQTRVLLNRVPRRRPPEWLPLPSDLPIACAIPSDYRALYNAGLRGRLVPSDSRLGRQFAAAARSIAGLPQETPRRSFLSLAAARQALYWFL